MMARRLHLPNTPIKARQATPGGRLPVERIPSARRGCTFSLDCDNPPMRTWSLWIVVLAVGAWISKGAEPLVVFSIDVYYDREYSRAELPTGGRFLDHPREVKTKYDIANRGMMWPDPGNAKKAPGFYLSKDGGTTWRRHGLDLEVQGTLYPSRYRSAVRCHLGPMADE